MKLDLAKALVVIGISAVAGLVGYAIYDEFTEPDSGIVVKREYSPAYDTVECETTDTGTLCSSTHYPACYEVTYYNKERDRKGDKCVSPEEYRTYKSGDYFPHE